MHVPTTYTAGCRYLLSAHVTSSDSISCFTIGHYVLRIHFNNLAVSVDRKRPPRRNRPFDPSLTKIRRFNYPSCHRVVAIIVYPLLQGRLEGGAISAAVAQRPATFAKVNQRVHSSHYIRLIIQIFRTPTRQAPQTGVSHII